MFLDERAYLATRQSPHRWQQFPIRFSFLVWRLYVASARRLKVVQVTAMMPKFLRQTDDDGLEEFSTKKGATIHGILWVKNARTEHQFYPMFIYHKLRVQTPKEFAGLAGRVLCATFCGYRPRSVTPCAARLSSHPHHTHTSPPSCPACAEATATHCSVRPERG